MDAAPPPFDRLGPARAATPVVLSVPHAGRHYPPALLAASAVPRAVLRQLEDGHVDQLIGRAVAGGAVAVVARTARAWIDLNRAPDEVDPAMGGAPGRPGTRVRSGLGLIPRRLGLRELLASFPDAQDVAARLAAVHAPYHHAIATALDAVRARYGTAVLIDVHSMPSLRGPRPAQIVIGDRHGRSASAAIVEAMEAVATSFDLRVSRNAPYAGAYTLDRHGDPDRHVHAVQLEIDRALYLDHDSAMPSAAAERIGRMIAAIGVAAADVVRPPRAIAAE